jgi:hypothetical protein
MTAPRNGLALVKRPDVPPGTRNHPKERTALDRLLAGARHGLGCCMGPARGAGNGPDVAPEVHRQARHSHARVPPGGRPTGDDTWLRGAAPTAGPVPTRPRPPSRTATRCPVCRLRLGHRTHAGSFPGRLAVLSLLTQAAAEEPLLVVVDDAQWIDQATAEVLAFVARRLSAEPIALVVAVLEPAPRHHPFSGLPDLHLSGSGNNEHLAEENPARVPRVRGTLSLVLSQFDQAPAVLLRAAHELNPREPERARRTLLDALYAGLMAGALPVVARCSTSPGRSARERAGQHAPVSVWLPSPLPLPCAGDQRVPLMYRAAFSGHAGVQV